MQISTAREEQDGSNGSTAGALLSLCPPLQSRGTGKGKLFWELDKGPGLNLLSMEGFHQDQWQAQP